MTETREDSYSLCLRLIFTFSPSSPSRFVYFDFGASYNLRQRISQNTTTSQERIDRCAEVIKMSYNHRMSMVPNTQQQNRGKKKEDDSDAFMRLV
jgi:kinetochore protein Nuf2